MTLSDVHLLLLIHGMWGKPKDLVEMHRHIREIHGEPATADSEGMQLRILLPETNRGGGTYDGIDWGGERVVEETYREIKKIENEGKKVTRFSVTGYSLGGLVSRYVVGILHQRKFFETVTPVNFNTVATPHIGLLRYTSVPSRVAWTLGPRLLSRTGEQFYCVDKWSTAGLPLLEVMTDPEHVFYKALLSFPHVRIYANAVNDMAVPYMTAAIESEDPFLCRKTNALIVELDERYYPLIKSWSVPGTPPSKSHVFSSTWFKSLRLPNIPVPALFKQRFPLNILVYLALPILLPTLLIVFLVRFLLAPCSSRSRIRVLEKDDSAGERLAHVLANLESQMEEVVVDQVNDLRSGAVGRTEDLPPTVTMTADKTNDTPTGGPANTDPEKAQAKQTSGKETEANHKAKGMAVLSASQHRMITSLNALPQLQKERAFIDGIGNSHDAIICRDVKHFKARRVGEGVLRHWADHFVL